MESLFLLVLIVFGIILLLRAIPHDKTIEEDVIKDRLKREEDERLGRTKKPFNRATAEARARKYHGQFQKPDYEVGPRGGTYEIRYNKYGKPYRHYF